MAFPVHLAVEVLSSRRILRIPRQTLPGTRKPILRTRWLPRAQSTMLGTTQLLGRRRSSSRSMDGDARWIFWRSVTSCRSNLVYVQGKYPRSPPDRLCCRVVPGRGQFLWTSEPTVKPRSYRSRTTIKHQVCIGPVTGPRFRSHVRTQLPAAKTRSKPSPKMSPQRSCSLLT